MTAWTWKEVPSAGDAPEFRIFDGEIEKPALDDRQYSLLELHNGIQVVVVSDQAADKAAACLTVATGYTLDPDDLPGLAHFCEHMITKASDEDPPRDRCAKSLNCHCSLNTGLGAFIRTNGGSRNAATGPTSTEYWFSISPTKLAGGLLRLAACFHAPLFTESLTAREINAVDSEYKRNLQNDARRVLQLTKSLSVPGHPWAHFGTGNYESLTAAGRQAGKDTDEEEVLRETRRRLVAWWKEQYCASRMMLAVVGRESVDELTALVVPHFSKIPNRGLNPRPAVKDGVWGPEHMGTVLFVQTVKDYYAVKLSFQLPDLREHYATKPAAFLAHFLGHEGPGSVCAYLKKKGWILDLSAGPSGRSREPQFFNIQSRLTLEGYLHYRDVVRAIFNYISLLRASALEPYHFAEVQAMAETSFRFQEKAQPHRYASTLAHTLSEPYPPEWLLSGAHLYREWNEPLVRSILEGFTPKQARVTLEAKNHLGQVIGQDVQWQSEKWYGTQYTVKRLEDSFLETLREPNANQDLHLPAPNPFIPEDLSVDKVEVPKPLQYPTLVQRTEMSHLWHKKDDQFWAPKVHVRIDIKRYAPHPGLHSFHAYRLRSHIGSTSLLVDLVDDALAEIAYDATLAGLSYSVTNQLEGLAVSVAGYNDKIHVLLHTVLEKLCGLQVQPERFNVIRENVQREYENFYMGQPSGLSETYAQWMFMPTMFTPAQKLQELPLLSESDIGRHRDDLLSKVFLEVLVNGNMGRERALDILHHTEECLNARPLSHSEIPRQRALLLPPGSDVLSRRWHANPKEMNSSLSYYLQFGEVTDTPLRCHLALIAHLMNEPCYSILRTQEQLGYVVGSAEWAVNGTIGLRVRIQSVGAPWFLESRVDAFLETIGARLAGMSAAEFDAQKDGLVATLLERPKNLGEETARFWGQIRAGRYDFLRKETDAATIRALTRAELASTYNALVRPSTSTGHPRTRKKLCVHLLSQQLSEDPPPRPCTITLGTEADAGGAAESAFKASLPCAPAATPVRSPALGEHGRAFGPPLCAGETADATHTSTSKGESIAAVIDVGVGARAPASEGATSARL
ncbi:LuxS/MPP-like metallohydrolase [Trametes coccinea BRFM310]|uniref:LuxS/MPP-like metallohydrolase n=1 Tax=Trametes coccinea (strain BRFM310) TaxID=1353009 RepID=A0A1Y2J4E5_TRAC3|nr:LuxS/MPP-like metallohydrolase [Trametes coccinea BRFM310]